MSNSLVVTERNIIDDLDDNITLGPEAFDALLQLATENSASEVGVVSGQPVMACVDHQWGPVTKRPIKTHEIESILASLHGPEAPTVLSSGDDLDFSHEIGKKRQAKRFRLNATGHQIHGKMSLDLTCRLMDATPPTLGAVGLTEEDFAACNKDSGVNLITGPTGSGKTTTQAAITRRHLEGPLQDSGREERDRAKDLPSKVFTFTGRKIIEYAAPIEYVYHSVNCRHGFIVQSEVGRNIPSFARAARNCNRRFAQIIILTETRDPETAVEIPNIGSTGHLLYTSFHGNNCGDSLNRFNMLFPAADRDSGAMNLLAVLNVIICQRLLPKKSGGVIAVREKMYLTEEIRQELFRIKHFSEWGNHLSNILREEKMDMAKEALRLVDQGIVEEEHAACLIR